MVGKDTLSNPKRLVPFLNKKLYKQGDCHSPGTGFCIKNDYKVYLSPAGLSVDLLESEDVFIFNEMLDDKGNPDVYQAPQNTTLKASTFSKVYLHLLEEFSCDSVLIAQSQDSILIGDLYSEKVVFSHRACLTNFTVGVGSKETLKPTDKLHIPIIEYKYNQDELISDIINALYSNMPTCACIVKGFGLIMFGDSWMNVRNMFQILKDLFGIELRYQQFKIRSNINNQVSALNLQVTDLATDFKVKQEREENLANLEEDEVFREYMISPDTIKCNSVEEVIKSLKVEEDNSDKHQQEENRKRKGIKINHEKEPRAKKVKGNSKETDKSSKSTYNSISDVNKDVTADEDNAEIELTLSATERNEFPDDFEDFIEKKDKSSERKKVEVREGFNYFVEDKENEDLSKNSTEIVNVKGTSEKVINNESEDTKAVSTVSDDDIDCCSNSRLFSKPPEKKEATVRQQLLIDIIQGTHIKESTNCKKGGKISLSKLKWLENCLDTIQYDGNFLNVDIQRAKSKLRRMFGCQTCKMCISSVGNSTSSINNSVMNVSAAQTKLMLMSIDSARTRSLATGDLPNSTRAIEKHTEFTHDIGPSNNKVPSRLKDVAPVTNPMLRGTVQQTSLTQVWNNPVPIEGSYYNTNIKTYSSQSQRTYDDIGGDNNIDAQATNFQGYNNFNLNNTIGDVNEGFNSSSLMYDKHPLPTFQQFGQPQSSFHQSEPLAMNQNSDTLPYINDPKVIENALKCEQRKLDIVRTAREAVLSYLDGEPLPASSRIRGSRQSRNIFEQVELYLETMKCSTEFKDKAIAYFRDAYLDPNYVPGFENNHPPGTYSRVFDQPGFETGAQYPPGFGYGGQSPPRFNTGAQKAPSLKSGGHNPTVSKSGGQRPPGNKSGGQNSRRSSGASNSNVRDSHCQPKQKRTRTRKKEYRETNANRNSKTNESGRKRKDKSDAGSSYNSNPSKPSETWMLDY